MNLIYYIYSIYLTKFYFQALVYISLTFVYFLMHLFEIIKNFIITYIKKSFYIKKSNIFFNIYKYIFLIHIFLTLYIIRFYNLIKKFTKKIDLLYFINKLRASSYTHIYI